MRTTLDIDDDILLAAKEIARRDKASAGSVISRLARLSLTGATGATGKATAGKAVFGFVPFESRPGVVITNEMIDRLRDIEGV